MALDKARLETVAYAIENRTNGDPGFSARRYAVKPRGPQGWAAPETDLSKIDESTFLDIAGWTCYQYPDLCDRVVDSAGFTWPYAKGMQYYANARRILGLSLTEADLLFAGLEDGRLVVDLENYTAKQAVEDLRALAALAQ